jgi:hypothetical protein|tara:strand:- start:99 stop:518 length:420 start_codon:yes stop_codon:yes gene_type:complete
MANKTKKDPKVIAEIMEELAIGQSIRSCLSPRNKNPERPCWQSFRLWMAKDQEIRKNYEQAKTDGIEYLLSDATDTINEALENSKFKEKTDLGQTHLIKSFIDLTKWKSERLAPKSYLKKDQLQVFGSDSSPLIVKWDK